MKASGKVTMSGGSKVPVLLLPMSLGIGGAETHVVGLARHLSARGWDVRVASAGGELVKDLAAAGIEHVTAPLDSRSPLDLWRAYRIVSNEIDRRRIGLVHAHARIPAWIAGRACAKREIPMAMTYHGTFVSGPFWNLFTRPGDRTIAVSADVRDYIAREFGFNREDIVVIPNGIDLEVFRIPAPEDRARSRRDFAVPPGSSPVVLYASRLDGDLTRVAEAAEEAALILRDKYPDLLLLVAGVGEGQEAVEGRASRVNRAAGRETVRCLGYLTETFPAYAASDVVVGMSRVALEAMASCRPVVVAGPGGVFGPVRPEIERALEERNYTSRNAPEALSPQAVAAQVGALLSDPAKCEALGRFGREQVAARHSMDFVTTETEGVYASLLERTGRDQGGTR
jgi:glycosyltransferase involved in cell wall biosynthesis